VAARADFLKSLADFGLMSMADRADCGQPMADRADFRCVGGYSVVSQVRDERNLIGGPSDRADFRCVGGYSASPQVLDEPRGYSFSPQVLDEPRG